MLGYINVRGNWQGFPKSFIWIFLIGFTLTDDFIDIKDYLGDKAQRIMTVPVLLKPPLAKLFIGSAFIFTSLAFHFYLQNIFLLPLLLVAGILGFYFIITPALKSCYYFLANRMIIQPYNNQIFNTGVIFFAGLAIANWGFNLFSLDHTLSRDYFSLQILLITLSLALISWFAVNLRGQISMTLDLSICLFIAFLLAQAVGFQTAFSMSIIAATTFLYECHPYDTPQKLDSALRYKLHQKVR